LPEAVRRVIEIGSLTDRWVAITPCRDEASYARRCIESVLGQTARPTLWVIVDDGSTDDTRSILNEYAAREPWIRVVRRDDRGARSVGPGVVDAFYAGLDTVGLSEYEYVCKLDLDVVLPPEYFERLIARMEADSRLGTCSGKPYVLNMRSGHLNRERTGDEMSVGATKFYRRECFTEIGGLVRGVMWDAIDCHRARMLGWRAESVDEAGLRFLHMRPMGSSQKSMIEGRLRWGRGQWFLGTGIAWILVSGLYRMAGPPLLVGGTCIIAGYLAAAVCGAPRYEDRRFRHWLRGYHRLCLILGKRRATRWVEREGEAVWLSRPVEGA
jgi:biofilm PGA synthesis N-glycosyltransferase PgaC